MGSSKSKEKKPKNQEAEKEKSKEDVQKEETEEEKAQKKKFAPVERTLVLFYLYFISFVLKKINFKGCH